MEESMPRQYFQDLGMCQDCPWSSDTCREVGCQLPITELGDESSPLVQGIVGSNHNQ